jgi:glutamine synthetase
MSQNPSYLSFLDSFLFRHPSIRYIRYQWVDYAGILRVRILTVSYCRRLAETSSPLPMSPVALTSTTINEWMPDLVATGVDHIHADYSSLRPCLYVPRHASVMCFVSEGIGNVGFGRCPRTLLYTALSTAATREVEINVGFEVEFRCLNLDGTDVEECMAGFSTAAGLRNRCFSIIEEVVEPLEESGIEVLQFHTESCQGLFEISTGPLPVVEAIDTLIYTRETIKMLFSKNNIIATMHPSPRPDHHGTAAQFHLSISPKTEATTDPFLAGILNHLPALCAFSLPLEESYKRVNDFGSEAGAYVAWGTQNRDVPIRQIRPGHWEVRCCDGTANMYLVMAGFIAAGLEGLKEGRELVWKDFHGVPSVANEQERLKAGITKKLPRGLAESLKELEELDYKRLGMAQAAKRYAKLKREELTSLGTLSDDARRALLVRHF